MTSLELNDKTVVVTGAAGGLGRAFAEAFAKAGARVVAADVNKAGAEETAARIEADGGSALGCVVDVTRQESVAAMVEAAEAYGEGIDVLVNNAAIYAGLSRRPFDEIEEGEWDRVIAVNLKGVWLCTKGVAASMRGRGQGAIINVSSATVMSGSPQWLHYVTSKGGVIAMTRALARELGDDRITVNAIAPGFTLTEASLGLVEDAEQYGVMRGALKRAALSDDMVGAALFFASAHASFITGQTLVVDGGRQFL
ncbi:SDR family NAD(P)-dependent oxidoreductase [Kaistia dalseonensis]|uniref:NAD(P)-dependent dehydrogenase (Short-subunit alcohol dehydrogenase family) n=1 Tax=Kaistia dalseonensis TaxID=410840 RepID=A0ABU0H8N8_9HYPH|nr:SDR family NAD(P)-dependent oxidoreductase [Kaistia dalseonensis]MCX5496075.1 SDR family NAD(P)-dependent oxidoreductase [Kaistia dalseonensis]MDQ0438679.1 NAD(P)-dependent dehydrogenase (short-subunit alcohol dehydrogenase family) [Kaistia dalseonensis]